MARKPDADLINRRLRMNGAGGAPPRIPAPNDGEDEPGFPFEFAMMVGALMLTVGIGSYIWFTGGEFLPSKANDNLVSVADPACRPLWVPAAKNTPGIVCYLTQLPERLCDPKERAHLSAVMRQYRLDRNAFETNMLIGGVKAAAVMKTQMSTDGIAAMASTIGSADGKPPSAEQQAKIDDHFATVKKMQDVTKDSVSDAALTLKHIPDQDLVGKIRNLALAGYVVKGDFGWFRDTLVDDAFRDLGPVGSPCKG
ncbi:hypothetical protein RB623_10865 [Mesorhizobium sp. LHD-90]|uniref:hypothetical protein n=1 Tax=Mesorhizobium sp. LHD-90 TaxID=3071414 RepID=UPI0027E02071|nr:hypothetical protein [Mesorhizobium sp. LHD-90]MDQ6434549.1 hypothetical protein [Mesorhizobium sp. LHD-90]